MSTNDVPSHNNSDELRMGVWGEHQDGSLIFVESTENDEVVYCMFDLSKDPPLEYRDKMVTADFCELFSVNSSNVNRPYTDRQGRRVVNREKWDWHDKTPFPWDRVIKEGARDGMRYASAGGLISAAARVAGDLRLRAERIRERGHLVQHETLAKVSAIKQNIQRALEKMGL